jgi:hypothetical protein
MPCRRGLIACLLAMVLALAAPHARSEMRALLVGVSDYPALPAGVQGTPGARNDVDLLRRTLRQRGFAASNIRVLADGLPDAAAPTRSNILGALDALAEASGPGDFVFLHFAGHGSLEPGAHPDEGASPIFLPIDIGRWNGGTGRVENAVTRHDLRERVDRIADRGAFVWAVFDTCHAANFVRRGEPGDVRRRFVGPSFLGVPTRAPGVRGHATAAATGMLEGRQAAAPGRGGTVFFYAAQAGESAVELPLPLRATATRPHGLFSYHVAMALQGGSPISYRQLAQSILTAYGAAPQVYATPIFTGDALDQLVLGQRVVPVRQWPLRADAGLRVEAGTLSGLVPGAVLAVIDDPMAAPGQGVVGHLAVAAAEVDHAVLEPVAFDRYAPPGRSQLRHGQYLRLASSPPAFTLRVADAAQDCVVPCRAVSLAVQRLRERGAEGVDLQWVKDLQQADIVIRPRSDRVDLLPSPLHRRLSPEGTDQPGLMRAPDEPPDVFAARLGQALHRAARARNLLALAAQSASRSPATSLSVDLHVGRAGEPAVSVALGTVPGLSAGDTYALTLGNAGSHALDVTVIYIDARHGVTVVHPGPLGESNRLPPGQSRRVEGRLDDPGRTGHEWLLVISRRAMTARERSDFSFLAQPSLTRTRAAVDPELDVLADAAFAEYRRRGLKHPRAPQGSLDMRVFTLDRQVSRRIPKASAPTDKR